jgi:hypothetical protein
VQNKLQEYNTTVVNLDTKKRELTQATTTVKQDIGKAFEEIRLKLQRKEKEILERCEINLQENLQEINTFTRVLNSKIVSLNKLLDSVNTSVVRRDEVSLLNFYAENHTRVQQAADTEIPDIPPLNVLQNLAVNINEDSVAGLINNLNGIHLEITSMKGVTINKVQKTQRIQRDAYGNISHILNRKVSGDKVLDNTSYDYSKNYMNLVKYYIYPLEYFV